LAEDKERYYARNEFMKIRLKWAEAEVSELQGDGGSVFKEKSKNRKKHLKKKKRKKS
jgi:hypothetical protein